jgi:hypothetical protein
MHYELVTKDDLTGLTTSLELLKRTLQDDMPPLYLYGLSNNGALLAKAEDVLQQMQERDVKLTEVAVAIPLSNDALRLLNGSGLVLRDEEFAYVSGGDGARMDDLSSSSLNARVSHEDFSEIALAGSEIYLDDFLAKHGAAYKQPPAAGKAVKRDSPATERAPKPQANNPIDSFLNT